MSTISHVHDLRINFPVVIRTIIVREHNHERERERKGGREKEIVCD